MFGKVMRVPDANLEEYWSLLLGEVPPEDLGPNQAKRMLARRLVERFHGPGDGDSAEAHFDRLFVVQYARCRSRSTSSRSSRGWTFTCLL